MILKSVPMAISSSFASRFVLCIATALLPSFVFYIYTSYAARVPQSLYGSPRLDANCIAIRSLYEFPTPSKIFMFFLSANLLAAPAPPSSGTASPSTRIPSVPSSFKMSSSKTSTQSSYYSAQVSSIFGERTGPEWRYLIVAAYLSAPFLIFNTGNFVGIRLRSGPIIAMWVSGQLHHTLDAHLAFRHLASN